MWTKSQRWLILLPPRGAQNINHSQLTASCPVLRNLNNAAKSKTRPRNVLVATYRYTLLPFLLLYTTIFSFHVFACDVFPSFFIHILASENCEKGDKFRRENGWIQKIVFFWSNNYEHVLWQEQKRTLPCVCALQMQPRIHLFRVSSLTLLLCILLYGRSIPASKPSMSLFFFTRTRDKSDTTVVFSYENPTSTYQNTVATCNNSNQYVSKHGDVWRGGLFVQQYLCSLVANFISPPSRRLLL